MQSNRKIYWTAVCLGLGFVLSCVTINIYFPAEKVESVAGEIVEEIRGPQKTEDSDDQSFRQPWRRYRMYLAVGPGAAWAQDVTDVSNAAIRTLKARMKERFAQIKPYYGKGALQEGDDGYVQMADAGSLDLKTRRTLTRLVDAENKDRRALYAEVAAALDIDPGQIDRVARIFAKEWQETVR